MRLVKMSLIYLAFFSVVFYVNLDDSPYSYSSARVFGPVGSSVPILSLLGHDSTMNSRHIITETEFHHKDFDSLMDAVGGFGKSQKRTVFLVILPLLLPTGFFAFSIVFQAATPEIHGCTLPIEDYNAKDVKIFSPDVTLLSGSRSYNHCAMYDLDYKTLKREGASRLIREAKAGNRTLPEIACQNGWTYCRDDFQTTMVTEFDLVCGKTWRASLAFAAQPMGGLVGTPFWAFIADRYGRKPALFSMMFFLLLFGVTIAFSPNPLIFNVTRFLAGMCTEFLYTLLLLMSLEITGTETRSLMSVICSIGYTFSILLVIGLAYFVRTWKYLAIFSCAPFFVLSGMWFFMLESPRWLLAQKRFTDVEIWLKKVAKTNRKMLDQTFLDTLPDILRKMDTTEAVHRTSILDLFRTPNIRRKTIILSFINLCNTGVYSGLNLFEPSFDGEPHYNALLVILVELPAYAVARFFLDNGGRRLSVFYPMLFCSAFCLATVLVPTSLQGIWILALTLCAKLCITLTFLVSELFEEELFPTVIRAQGHSFTIVVSQLAAISVPFVVQQAEDYAILPLIIFGALCCCAAVSVLFLPETLGKELPQNIADGELTGQDMKWKEILTICRTLRRRKPDKTGDSETTRESKAWGPRIFWKK